MTSLLILGGVALQGDAGPLSGPATQRHRLALLALLASAYPRGLLREKLVAYLWPERGPGRARNLLSQAIHAVRSQVGDGAVVSAGDEVRLAAEVLGCDMVAFEEALAAGDHDLAVALYRGPLLDGFFLPDAPEFERWLETERRRLAGCYRRALEALARAATESDDRRAAVGWWQRLAAEDPYNSDVTIQLMRALEAAGNRAAAIQVAQVHRALVEGDLSVDPDPAVEDLAERMRTAPSARARTTNVPADPPVSRDARPGVPRETSSWRRPRRWTRRAGGRAALAFAAGATALAVGALIWESSTGRATSRAGRAGAPPHDSGAPPSTLPTPAEERASATAPVGGDLTAPQYVRRANAQNDVSDAGNLEAERLLRLALRADSTNAEAWAELAILYSWRTPYLGAPTSAWDSALVYARRSLDLDPASANAYTGLAAMYGHQGMLALEERMAREALRRDPENSLAVRRLGESYHERGDFLQALRYHRETVRLQPTDGAYRSFVGHVYLDLEAYGSAERWYRGALALKPGELGALEGMVELYLKREMPDSARHYADVLVRLHPRETIALGAAAAVSHYLRDVDAVRRLAGRAVEIAQGAPVRTPHSILATTMLGFAELTVGDTARAEAHFDESVAFLEARLESGADSPRWPYELALIDAARGDMASAFHLLEQAYALGFRWPWMLEAEPMLSGARDDPRFRALVARTRADVEAMRGGM